MNKKTKIGIIIAVIILLIAIIAAAIIFTNPFEESNNEDIEALNNQENEVINNIIENNEIVNEEENEEVNNDVEETEVNNEEESGYEANTSDEEKAIELVKKEWGEDDTVVFDLSGVTADGKYRVSVNRDTKVLAWYIVDVETGTVTQK